MKILLTITAIIESATGLVLIFLPSLLTRFLFDSFPDTAEALTFARVAGAAILSLAVACWLARNEEQSSVARGIVSAMLLYNIVVAIVLIYSGIGLTLAGIDLWLVVVLHVVMAAWCSISLFKKPFADDQVSRII